jgi:competence protein ComEA
MRTKNLLRVSTLAIVVALLVFSGNALLAANKPAAGKVDLNSADLKTLEALPGVGAATAKHIIAARPFKSVEDLKHVKGIGDAKFAALKDKVSVGGAAAAPAPGPGGLAAPAAPAKPAAPVAKAPAASSPGPGGLQAQAAPAKPAAPAANPAVRAPSAPAAKLAPGQKININTATKEQLDMLPDIGGVKAQAIIDGRPYQKIEDIMKVKGIKEGIFAKIKDHITVS